MASTVQPSEALKTFHERVRSYATSLGITKSTANGRVSSHVVSNSTTFASMFQFQKLASDGSCGEQTFVGSISGELVYSVNILHKKGDKVLVGKKRRADTTTEEATRAILRVQKSGSDANSITEGSYNVAKQTISNLLKIKGSSGENALESWAVSLRKPGDYGAAPSKDGRSSLVIAARMAGGLPIPMSAIYSALQFCKDGMITVSNDKVSTEFDLPMTEQCKEAHERGQKSILFLASVPHVDSAPSNIATGLKEEVNSTTRQLADK